MAGTKNASKTSSKAVVTPPVDGQRSLFHFYKKKGKPENKASEVVNAVTESPLGLGNSTSSLPTLSSTGGMATLTSHSAEPRTEQRQPLEASFSSFVDEHSTNDTQEPDVPQTFNHPHNTQSEPATDVHALRELSRSPSRLESDPLQQADVMGGFNLLSGVQGIDASTPLTRDLFPIFKRHLSSPSSPPSAAGKRGNGPPSLRGPSPTVSPPDPRQRPETHIESVHADEHSVVDLAESPHQDTLETAHVTVPHRHQSIIVVDDEPDTSGRQGEPIEISSSPPEVQQTKSMHPFFARRAVARNEDKVTSTPLTAKPTSLQMDYPWPDAQTQHTRGPQSCFWPSASSPFPVYRRFSQQTWFSSQPDIQFLQNRNITRPLPESSLCAPKSRAPTPLEREEILSKIPSCHWKHPGISRLFDAKVEPRCREENGEAWTYKWRPRSTAEVLGNEDNVRYIKQWLQALEICATQTSSANPDGGSKSAASTAVRGVKRSVVVRAVQKKRGNKRRKVESDDESLGGWIVQEGEEEETASENPAEDQLLLPRSSFLDGNVAVSPPSARQADGVEEPPGPQDGQRYEFAHLTNTIVLAGPPGCGKTSTVYACAEELGWEVFEVYPGIGRRSGSNISTLVGDVGKNHIIGRRGTGAKRVSVQNSIFESGFGYLAGDHPTAADGDCGTRVVRQSIILLEEVDILFKEDANFWPAVVNMIKYSHRPVLMTCNDISLVPRDDLPLQATLVFQPCPAPLAISFLQSVCLAEGHVVPKKRLDAMYSVTYELSGFDQPDEPQVPYPSQPQASSDLRRVLNDLQFWCQLELSTDEDEGIRGPLVTIPPRTELLADWSKCPKGLTGCGPGEGMSQGDDIFLLWKHSENASYVDGFLEPRPWDALEALAIDRYGPSVDDEIGHTLLEKPRVLDRSNSLSFYNQDEVMAQEVLVGSRHVLESAGTGRRTRSELLGDKRGATLGSRSLLRDRATNQTLVVSYLDDVIPLSAPLLPRPAAILEYAAYVRKMVEVDDLGGRGGREMRSGMRMYERYMKLSEEGENGARKTRLSG